MNSISSKSILDAIGQIQFENTFNPYTERCLSYDTDEAPELRRYYIMEILERAAAVELDAVWVGRDLGYRGGRRTGLPLTDDIHFSQHLLRWGLEPTRITKGNPVPERTAAVIWDILMRVNAPVFLWNVFPLHPFDKGHPFTNRTHNARERKVGVEILFKILHYLKPRRIIAIGNDAFNVLSVARADYEVFKVRHPSYGGQNEFSATMNELYSGLLKSKQGLFM